MKALARLTLLLLVLALTGLAASAVLTEEEARAEFQRLGCVGCHNNVLAPDFDGTVAKIVEWASKYETLDEAVAAESAGFKEPFKNVKSWSELMSRMPGITEEMIKFFEEVFRKAKEGKVEAPTPATPTPTPAPTTPTPQPTPTPVPEQKVYELPTVPVTDAAEASKPLVREAAAIGIAFYLISIGVLIAVLARLRRR